MDKPTWTIHCITDIAEYEKDCEYIGNFHTHGLNKYNNKEQCKNQLASFIKHASVSHVFDGKQSKTIRILN